MTPLPLNTSRTLFWCVVAAAVMQVIQEAPFPAVAFAAKVLTAGLLAAIGILSKPPTP